MTTYYVPGAHKISGQRQTFAAKIRLWKRRRKTADLAWVRT